LLKNDEKSISVFENKRSIGVLLKSRKYRESDKKAPYICLHKLMPIRCWVETFFGFLGWTQKRPRESLQRLMIIRWVSRSVNVYNIILYLTLFDMWQNPVIYLKIH